jgi:fibronectin-binding autotransporter adhesin
MTKNTIQSVSRVAIFAVITFASASLFATQLISIVPGDGGDIPIGPIKDSNVPDPDGTWIYNTNSTAQNWSNSAAWAGGVIADGGGKADFSTLNITGARGAIVDSARTVGRLDIGDTNNTHSYTISAGVGVSLTFDNTANSADAQLNQTVGSAGDTISAPLILNSTLDVANASTSTLTLSGAISGVGGLKLASGTLALGTSASTYAGGTTISAGAKITIGASGTPLGSGTLTLAGGTLTSTANRSTALNSVVVTADSAITTTSTAATVNLPFNGTLTGTAGTLTIRNDAASGTGLFDVRFSGGDYTMTQDIIIDNGAGTSAARLSDFNTSGTTHTYNGVISGNGSYNRSVSSGSGGITIFNGNNTYTGTTTVNNGTLLVNGNQSAATGAVTVNLAGTLGGTGTVGGAVSVSGTISPGASVGTFTTISTLSIAAGGTYKFELNSNTSTADKIIAAGVSLASTATISLSDLGSTALALSTSFTVIDNTSGSAISGTFSNVADGSTFTIGLNTFQANYEGGDGNDLVFTTVVPEPTTVGMVLLGASLLAGVQRFRRRQG